MTDYKKFLDDMMANRREVPRHPQEPINTTAETPPSYSPPPPPHAPPPPKDYASIIRAIAVLIAVGAFAFWLLSSKENIATTTVPTKDGWVQNGDNWEKHFTIGTKPVRVPIWMDYCLRADPNYPKLRALTPTESNAITFIDFVSKDGTPVTAGFTLVPFSSGNCPKFPTSSSPPSQ